MPRRTATIRRHKIRLDLPIQAQPDDTSCGPACLHALYRYHGDPIPMSQVIAEVGQLEGGGTLAVLLAVHALKRGYDANIYTYNLVMFDPTWFRPDAPALAARLREQARSKHEPKLQTATASYLEFLALGGQVHFEDLTASLIRKHLRAGLPILTGLSSTYLYHAMREYGPKLDDDDVRGEPQGHFVVVSGYERQTRMVHVADPLHGNPTGKGHYYAVSIHRLIGAILLGIVTYDANLLIIRPRDKNGGGRVDPVRGQ